MINKTRKTVSRADWELLRELIRANFKAYDHNSVLGIFWSFLNPAIFFIVTYFIFRHHFSSGSKTYPVYLLSGIIAVNFFVTATSHMIKLLTNSREFILNTTVPRDIFIASSFFTHAYKFSLDVIFCTVLSYFFGVFSIRALLPLAGLWAAYLFFVIGVGMLMALIYCFVRDAEHLWGLFSRLLFLGTPIVYYLDQLPPLVRTAIYFFNPLTPFVESFHQIMALGQQDWLVYSHCLLLSAVTFMAGFTVFTRFEKQAMETA